MFWKYTCDSLSFCDICCQNQILQSIYVIFVRKMVQKLPFSLLIDLKTYNIHDILEGRENEIWLYHCIVAAKNIIPWSPWCQLSRTSSLFHDAVSFTWQINMWQETWQIRPKKSFEKTENLAKLLLKRAGLGEKMFSTLHWWYLRS